MRQRRPPERGERARVARRVRALLEQHPPGSDPPEPHLPEPHPPGLDPPSLDPRGLDPPGLDPWESGPRGPESSPIGIGPARHGVLAPGGRLSGWLQRKGVRVDPGHRGGVAMGLAAVVAALVAGWWVLSSRPHAVTVSSSAAPVPASAHASSTSSTGPARLVVDIVGKVRRPGVYHLPDGARVDDALRAAGGALPGVELRSLNLARKVVDGEQIAVGVTGAVPGGGGAPSGSGPSGAASGPVNLNTADLAQFDTLPGVGPVLAQRIVDWRTAHGRFESVDQLREVTGIGPSRFDDLKPLVTV